MYQSCLCLSGDESEQQAHKAERNPYQQNISFGLVPR